MAITSTTDDHSPCSPATTWRRPLSTLLTVLAMAGLLASGCTSDSLASPVVGEQTSEGEPTMAERPVTLELDEYHEPMFEEDEEDQAEPAGPPMLTVGHLLRAKTCSTAATTPLNIQLAAEKNCIEAGSFAPISDIPNVKLGPAANPFMQGEAAASLRKVAAEHPEETFAINSSWRSVIQQHILKRWQGRCGIRIAARPGTSNHESGLALDVPYKTTKTFRDALNAQGWTWYCDRNNRGRYRGCRDVPHHTFRGQDLRSLNVLAFQRLWNHSHPADKIPESGYYDNATAARMDDAPLAGFPAGTTCDADAFVTSVVEPVAAMAEREFAQAAAGVKVAPPRAPTFPELAPKEPAASTASITFDNVLATVASVFE